ncbi:MAG: hypothetical protein Q9221_007564 [Calogaya cf. arnoldii]
MFDRLLGKNMLDTYDDYNGDLTHKPSRKREINQNVHVQPNPSTYKDLDKRYTEFAWTDADIKAIATCRIKSSESEKFYRFQNMVEPLKYTRQIVHIGGEWIKFDDTIRPRLELTLADVLHAYDKRGRFSNPYKSLEHWKDYCVSPKWAGKPQFDPWEYSLHRAKFYMYAGLARSKWPKTNPIWVGNLKVPIKVPAIPLDNCQPEIQPDDRDQALGLLEIW